MYSMCSNSCWRRSNTRKHLTNIYNYTTFKHMYVQLPVYTIIHATCKKFFVQFRYARKLFYAKFFARKFTTRKKRITVASVTALSHSLDFCLLVFLVVAPGQVITTGLAFFLDKCKKTKIDRFYRVPCTV